VARQPAHNVIVHNVSEQHQEEHKSNLHEAFFERQAEIAATDAFQSRSRILPPSRMGIGSKFKIPRFTLMSTMSEITASGPFRTASPAAREMPTAPWSCFTDTRPLKSFATTPIVSLMRSPVIATA